MSERQWWAMRGTIFVGPHKSREAAAKDFFESVSFNPKDVMTGYGTFGPSFDIQWVKREEENGSHD